MGFVRRVYHKLLLVPSVSSSFRKMQGDYATVFMLHRIRDGEPGTGGIDSKQLRMGLEYLRRNCYELVSLAELFARLAGNGPRLRGAVAFTLDDGYRDQAEIAGPIFSELDCPVTTFVTTGFLDGMLWLWWDKIAYIFTNTRRKALVVQVGETAVRYRVGSDSERSAMCADFVERCELVDDEEKHSAIARLAEEAHIDVPDAAPARYAPMTWNDVRTGEGRGMTFGPHTVTHAILSRTTPERADWEISESWRRLQEEARHPVPVFCYPRGLSADFGNREMTILRELGLIGALSAESGFADPASFQSSSDGRYETKRMPFPKELSSFVQYVSGIERFKQTVRGLASGT